MTSDETDARLIAATAVKLALTGRGSDTHHFGEQVSGLETETTDELLARAIEMVHQRLLTFASISDKSPEEVDSLETEAVALVDSLR